MDIKMIASDVDRTLLTTDGRLTEETISAIRAAQEKGILFAICSGRYPEHVGVLLEEHGLTCPVIGFNGGALWDPAQDRVIASHTMDPDAAVKVYDVISRYDVRYYVFGHKTLATRLTTRFHPSERMFRDVLVEKYGIQFTHGPKATYEASRRPVCKFIVLGKDNPEVMQEVHVELSRIEGIELTSSSPSNIEIVASGVSKGTGVAEMAAAYGIPLENVMVAGDYENDVPMFRVAGLSVAMGNAPEYIQKQAKVVTDTNDNNGLAKAIRRYALGEMI